MTVEMTNANAAQAARIATPRAPAHSFGDLRSLLQRQASASLWGELCVMMDALAIDEEPARFERTLRYAQDNLRRWDDALREAPRRWVDRLLRGESCPQLRIARTINLRVTGRELGLEFARRASAFADLTAIRALDLGYNYLGPEAASWLAHTPHLHNLEALNLDECSVGDFGLYALMNSPHLKSLQKLSLRADVISDGGLEAFGASPLARRLRELDLSRNDLSTRGVRALARQEQTGALESLALEGCSLGELGVRAVTEAPLLRQLRALDISRCGVDAVALEGLVRGATLPALHTLHVAGNGLGWSGLAIAQLRTEAPPLRALYLRANRLGHDAPVRVQRALTSGGPLRVLEQLDLSRNALGPTGAALLARINLRALRELDLSHNELGPLGLDALLDTAWFRNVRVLRLDHNRLGDEGAYQLASGSWPHLESLHLRDNAISGDGLRVLRAHFPTLRLLDLDDNDEAYTLDQQIDL